MNNFADGTPNPSIEELKTAWVAFERIAGVRAIKTDAEHKQALQLMRLLWDVVDEDVSHPLASLFELLVSIISDYEKKRYPMPQSEPHEMLAFMMEQGDHSATDLLGIVESAQLEEILAGHQKIDTALAHKLANYFHVVPQLFLKT